MALKLRHLLLTDIGMWNPFGTNFSQMNVDKNLICAENLDFDNKVLPRWKAQVWIFVLNDIYIYMCMCVCLHICMHIYIHIFFYVYTSD